MHCLIIINNYNHNYNNSIHKVYLPQSRLSQSASRAHALLFYFFFFCYVTRVYNLGKGRQTYKNSLDHIIICSSIILYTRSHTRYLVFSRYIIICNMQKLQIVFFFSSGGAWVYRAWIVFFFS